LYLIASLTTGWGLSHAQVNMQNNPYQNNSQYNQPLDPNAGQYNPSATMNNPATSGGLIHDLNPVTALNGGANGRDQPKAPYAQNNQDLGIYGEKPVEKGWQAMADVLKSITPDVDTRIPPTATDLTTRYQYLLDNGRYAEALKEIEARIETEKTRKSPGVDVQLMFLHARALALVGQLAEAEDIYQKMTVQYPELSETWNNLAAIYVKRGDLDQAKRALEMAIMINPGYGIAQANLGDVYLMMALRAYDKASAQKVAGIAAKMEIVSLLNNPTLSGAKVLKSARKISAQNINILSAVDRYLKTNYISQKF